MTDKGASAITYSAAGSAIFLGLTANEVAAIIAAVVAISTFLVNWYYRHRHFKLAAATVENKTIPRVCRGCIHAPHIFREYGDE